MEAQQGLRFFFILKNSSISLTKNITALTIAQITTSVCNFLSISLIAKMLGPAGQGQWAIYINAFTVGTLALGFGLPPAINHFLAAGKLDKKTLVGQLFLFSILGGLVFLLGAYAINNFALGAIVLPSVVTANFVIPCLAAHFFLLLFNQFLVSILYANKKFTAVAWITVIGAMLLLISYAINYFGYVADYTTYLRIFIILNLAVLLVQSVLYLFNVAKLSGFGFRISFFSKPLFMLLLGFAAWAYLTNLLQFFNYKMDVWFIEAFEEDDKQLGLYSIAVALSQLIWLLPNALHTIIFTETSENPAAGVLKKLKTWSVRIFFIATGMAFVGYILSFRLIPIFFGEKYMGLINVLPYLLPGIVVFAPSILLSAYFAGINRVDINFKSSAIGFVACLILNIALIPTYSIVGAAIASSVSYVISALVLYLFFKKRVKSHF